jgi:Skp family chaperone for outer membrane proteins
MEFRVVDFEILTKNYKNYQEGIKNIDNEKKEFIRSLDPVKKEMESIINQMSSGLIIDEKTQREKEEKFKSLQDQALSIDNRFKVEMKKLHEDLNTKTFAELSEIIEEYSKSNNIDLVIGKMEVVYLVDKFEITEQILDALRTKDLFYEEVTEVIEEKTEEKTEESL